MFNNMNREALQNTRAQLQAGTFPTHRDFQVEGEWLLEEGAAGQFQATLTFPQGSITLVSDQPQPTGGRGRAPNPVQYCVFAMVACFLTTFVTLATERGVALRKLRARGGSRVNMKAVFGLEDAPVVEEVWVDLEVAADASREVLEDLLRAAEVHCPAAFTVTHQVPFRAQLV